MQTDREFEDEVRRIARLLWPAAEFGGAAMEDGQERDGIFVTEENVHLIECTTSRAKDKAREDAKKLARLLEKYRRTHRDLAAKAWFITRDEPTADQREAVRKQCDAIVCCSYDHFRSKLIDARTYLECRAKYPFGSARDPVTGNIEDKSPYVALRMTLLGSTSSERSTSQVSDDLLKGGHFSLLGDYGAGKSTTMKKVYDGLRARFGQDKTTRFPVFLNMRDHNGQTNAAEVLERHARYVGYNTPYHLVRAWRAGFITLLLDGFDEIAIAGWSGITKKLKNVRYQALQILREFLRETPVGCGVMISGRAHFFDSSTEMKTAFGDTGQIIYLTLNEFTPEQVTDYLTRRGCKKPVPAWLPTRPLLLSYLACRGLVQESAEIDSDLSPAAGWDALLTRICEREAEIKAGIDGETVRSIIERLATTARRGFDGLGPLNSDDLFAAFAEICGYPPDEGALVLLQRLPGLGPKQSEDGSRYFIDSDLSDVARAGDVVAFVQSPFSVEWHDTAAWQCALQELGLQVGARRCLQEEFSAAKLSTAIHLAATRGALPALCADVFGIINEMDLDYTMGPIYVREAVLPEVCFHSESGDLSKIHFQDCIFKKLEFEGEVPLDKLPIFTGCYFAVVEGRSSRQGMPEGRFDEHCVYDSFAERTLTTAGLLDLPVPTGTKVVLTILKKLYVQAGRGRKESALHRGLDHRTRRLVPDALDLLRKEGLAVKSRGGDVPVWLPVRNQSVRVHRILASPKAVNDSVIEASKELD